MGNLKMSRYITRSIATAPIFPQITFQIRKKYRCHAQPAFHHPVSTRKRRPIATLSSLFCLDGSKSAFMTKLHIGTSDLTDFGENGGSVAVGTWVC